MSESLTKTKLKDPYILNLLQNIRRHRSKLENLENVKINPKLSNIILNENGKELFIENEFHKARGFRKLHIEIGGFSNKLKILHCVFFPDPKFNIPIFGMDLVKVDDVVSAAIVDISPVSNKQNLKLNEILGKVDKSSFSTLRKIPDWGNIFSENVFFASLTNEFEKKSFCNIVEKYLSTIIKLSSEAYLETDNELIQERIYFQKNYCLQQMKNEKTKMILLKYFDETWVNNYIEKVLFDF